MDLNKYAKQAGQKVLVFGEPKSGKTASVGKLAKYFKLLWIDLENGTLTLVNHLTEEEKKNVTIARIPDTLQNPIAIKIVDAIFRGTKLTVCDEHGLDNCKICREAGAPVVEFDVDKLDNSWVVVIDSLTQLSASALNYATRDIADLDKIEFKHYDQQGFYLSRILTNIQQAKYNVCVITHEAALTGADKEELIRPVGGTKNFSKLLSKHFDHVVYTEVKNLKHVSASGTDYRNNIITGSRTSVSLEKGKDAEQSQLALLFFSAIPEAERPPEINEIFKKLESQQSASPTAGKPGLLLKK